MTIRAEVTKLLQRKRPLTYQQIVDVIHQRHPECKTSVKTVQWYASRLRVAGEAPRVALLRRRLVATSDRPSATAEAKSTPASKKKV